MRTTPAKNAPIIASSPASCAMNDAENTKANTKIYWDTLSSYFLKNHRVMRGKEYMTIVQKIVIDIKRRIQNISLISPCCIPAITARMISAPNTVMIVPAMVVVTDVARDMP